MLTRHFNWHDAVLDWTGSYSITGTLEHLDRHTHQFLSMFDIRDDVDHIWITTEDGVTLIENRKPVNDGMCKFESSKGDCPAQAAFNVHDGTELIDVCGDHLPLQVKRIAEVASDHAVSVYVIEEN